MAIASDWLLSTSTFIGQKGQSCSGSEPLLPDGQYVLGDLSSCESLRYVSHSQTSRILLGFLLSWVESFLFWNSGLDPGIFPSFTFSSSFWSLVLFLPAILWQWKIQVVLLFLFLPLSVHKEEFLQIPDQSQYRQWDLQTMTPLHQTC
jgi:hypothetical protein